MKRREEIVRLAKKVTGFMGKKHRQFFDNTTKRSQNAVSYYKERGCYETEVKVRCKKVKQP